MQQWLVTNSSLFEIGRRRGNGNNKKRKNYAFLALFLQYPAIFAHACDVITRSRSHISLISFDLRGCIHCSTALSWVLWAFLWRTGTKPISTPYECRRQFSLRGIWIYDHPHASPEFHHCTTGIESDFTVMSDEYILTLDTFNSLTKHYTNTR